MTTRDRVRSFIAETFFVDDFKDDDSFLVSGIIDSTGMMEVVLFLEQEFDIPIRDVDLTPDNLDSVEKVTAFVTRKRRAADAA
jgi:acyl carrier protein